MALQTPTTEDVRDTIIANLQSKLNQTIPLLPKAFLRVLANTMAAVYILLWKYCGFNYEQMFVATASDQPTEVNGRTVIPLQQWGVLIGVGTPKEAVQAVLTVNVTVLNQTGSLPVGTELKGVTNGVTYVTTSEVLLDAAVVQANIRADEDLQGGDGSGTVGNLDNGEVVSFINTPPEVEADTAVSATVTLGIDEEPTEDYRQRIVDRFRKIPQGGAAADYEIWAESVTGVVNAYVYAGAPGEVDVYVEVAASIDPDGIAPQSVLDDVAAAIELDDNGLASRRPLGTFVNTASITRTAFTVEVNGLTAPDQASTEQQVTDAIETYFLGRAPYVQGITFGSPRDVITVSDVITEINPVIFANNGSFSSVTINGGAVTTYQLGDGEKAKATASYL